MYYRNVDLIAAAPDLAADVLRLRDLVRRCAEELDHDDLCDYGGSYRTDTGRDDAPCTCGVLALLSECRAATGDTWTAERKDGA